MLEYRAIHQINAAQRRLKRGSHWRSDQHTEDTDRLLMFTLGPQAQRDSQANLDAIMTVARDFRMDLVVARDERIQLAGSGSGAEASANALFSRAWLTEFNDWVDSARFPTRPMIEHSGHGQYAGFDHWRHCFVLPEQVGVYDVATGQRLTNRRDIIQRYWDLGFAAWRGRPASIAKLRWSGTRDELKELSEIADRYWTRGLRRETEVSKRLVSAFRSINRYAAWPGAW